VMYKIKALGRCYWKARICAECGLL